MRFRSFTCSLVFLAALALPAHAQDGEDMPYFNRGDAREAIKQALEAVHNVKCGADACAQATTEEFVTPPIEMEDARFALMSGATSARLKWCELNWQQRTFPAMMQSFQERGIHNLRSLAMLRLIHDAQFRKDFSNLQVFRTCSDDLRAKLDKQHPALDLPPWQGVLNNALLDESVATMLQRVLNDIGQARCGMEKCAPATEAEKANPPITIEQARQAMKVGLSAGVAQFCELDWKNLIFLPFMGYHQHKSQMEARQLSIMSMLFATMQGFILDSYKKHEKTCSEQMRDNLEKQFSRS
ncbi:MAG: hypothetical protein ACFCUR_03580 [Rhodomicrobiaceae bacterium]